jgi:ketosteroid isomerase-like protein
MSANLDLVRSIFAEWERGDFSRSDWADTSIEWVEADGPVTGTWTGLARLAEGTREVLGVWEDGRVEPEDYRELDSERILVFVRYGGRGKTSGLEFEQLRTTSAWLVEVHDGKVTKFVRYWDRDRALADLGLEGYAASEENVELVRAAWEAWERGDLDGLLAIHTEDVILGTTHIRDWPEREYRGHDGFRRFLTEWLEVWDGYEVGVDGIIPAPDGRVVSLFWQRGKGRQSGLSMAVEGAAIATVRDDRIGRQEIYDDRAQALKAVCL